MREVGQIDVRGQLQLIGITLGVVAAWVLLMVTQPWSAAAARSGTYPLVVVGVSALVAGGAVGLQLWGWHREGGRPAVAEMQSWIRAGAVPADVPREQWQPMLQRRIARRAACWTQIGLGVFWLLLVGFEVLTDTSPADSAWRWSVAAIWLVLVVWNLVEVLRRIPRIRRIEAAAGRAAREREPLALR